MGQLTLQLPKTLHNQLEVLAQSEGLQLDQYVFYILTRQVMPAYIAQVVPKEVVSQQETDYAELLQKWEKASPAKVKEVLAKREVVEAEPELRSETVAKLQARIADQQVRM
ncbi:MAG: toxin-antitoxin system HicB family antitoxin [Chloroflexi bacterium]|nr:toxin-antitoxin system HicB family antitoxin [Chloroflexota bacterium]